MSLTLLALMGGTALVTAVLTAVIGFGGGTVLIAVMLLYLHPAAALPIHGAVQLVGNFWRVWLMRRQVYWPLVWRYTLLLVPGVALGLWIFQGLPKEVIQVLIGLFVLGSLAARNVRWLHGRDLPPWAWVPVGFVMGVLNMTVGVVAPILAVLILRRDLRKEQIVATLSMMSGLGHAAKVAAFGLAGVALLAQWPALLVMMPAVLLGTVLGRWLLRRVPESVFLLAFRVLLVALGAKLVLWEGWKALRLWLG